MTTIVLDTLKHRGKPILLLKFPYNRQLIELCKQLPNARFSQTHKAWYADYSIEILQHEDGHTTKLH